MTAWPRQDIEKQLRQDDRVPTYRLPSGAVQAEGTEFELRVDPVSLPADVINDDGKVHFLISVVEPTLRLMGSTEATVSIIKGAESDDALWIDPLHPLAEGHAVAPANLSALDPAPETVAVSVRMLPSTTEAIAARTAVSGQSQAQAAGCANDWTLDRSSNRRAMIATTHVVYSASKGWAGHAINRSVTMGTATKGSYGATWNIGGTKTVGSGYSFEWTPSSANTKAYYPIVRYGLYRYEYASGGTCFVYDYAWKPRYFTGNDTDETSTDYPSWKGTCETDHVQSKGVWTRQATNGENFFSDVGVKIYDEIGFNLSSERSYSTSTWLKYDVQGDPKMLCGSGGQYPAYANRVRLRSFDSSG